MKATKIRVTALVTYGIFWNNQSNLAITLPVLLTRSIEMVIPKVSSSTILPSLVIIPTPPVCLIVNVK